GVAATNRPVIASAAGDKRKAIVRAATEGGTPPFASSVLVRARYSNPAASPAASVCSCIRVATNPGATQFTLIPCSTTSNARLSTSRTTATLLHAYDV